MMSSMNTALAARESMMPAPYDIRLPDIVNVPDTQVYTKAAFQVNQYTLAIGQMQAICGKNVQVNNYFSGIADAAGQAAMEQKDLNSEVKDGAKEAFNLGAAFTKALSQIDFGAISKKCRQFIDDSMEAYNRQSSSEMQLAVTLSNTAAVPGMTVQAGMDITPAEAAYSRLTEKAAQIQDAGMYTDEAMITGAAELSLHVRDPEAVATVMDTLSDYAAGASGGQTVDTQGMQGYAAQLGAALEGNYDGLVSMGFRISDAQKEIIANGSDMQKALALDEIVSSTWGGLYETMSNTPQGQIGQLNNAWNNTLATVGQGLYPFILLFVNAISSNWGTIESCVNTFAQGLQTVIGILSKLLEGAFALAGIIMDNWTLFAPVIAGIVAALGVYYGWQLMVNAADIAGTIGQGALTLAKMLAVPVYALLSGTTMASTAAQLSLNKALYACPLVWIIILIIALIAVFYVIIALVNKFAGTSISAAGVICGAFAYAGAVIANLLISLYNQAVDVVVFIWNLFAKLANFIGNFLNDPVAAVARLFVSLADNVLGILEVLAGAIDKVFGSNLAGAVAGWRGSLNSWVEDKYGQEEQFVSELEAQDFYIDYMDPDKAFASGYAAGEGFEDKVSNFDLGELFGAGAIPDTDELLSQDNPVNFDDYSSLDQYTGPYGDSGQYGGIQDGMEGISENTGNIADSTGTMAESMSVSQEDLKYLRDLAEQETVNRFTTAEIIIEQTNNNQMSPGMDYGNVISGLTGMVNEAVEIIAEGVHV